VGPERLPNSFAARNRTLTGAGVVAALPAEARALGPSMRSSDSDPFEELATLSGSRLAISGIGYEGAQSAARALVDAGVTALMTFGMAGGLDPALKAGCIVLPAELISPSGSRFVTCRSWRERIAAAVSSSQAVTEGNLLTSALAIESVVAKAAAYRSSGAVAVDMESAAVAEVAAAARLPFIAVRVIVDTAADALPRAVVAASRAGRVRMGRLIAGLLLAPGQIKPLMRLSQRYRTAMRSLRVIAEAGVLAPLDTDS
jgi:adenosylhomocysteine nucleosidase